MTTRIQRLLAACAAAAIVVPTVALAQQPTMLQLYNLNGSAVGGRWLVRPPVTPNTGGPYTITLPDASGTLLTGSGTANRMTRWTGTGTLGNGSLDDDASGTLSRTGNININPGGANTLATNGNLSATGTLTITGTTNLNGAANIGNGNDNINVNAGAANTFQITSNGLNVATNGDLSDAGGAVVINDADGLDLNNNLILNVGNAGTDFTAGGGLTLAGALVANGAATLGSGDDNITINAGAANTFQLTSNGLNIATNGDISDAGGAVVINDAQGLDLNNNLILNVGNAGTDFTAGGGLTLAGALVANGAATLGSGDDNITINAGAANTFQLTSNGLNVATSGDLSDAGGAVVINDAQGLDMSNTVIANIGAAGTDFTGTGGLTLADALSVTAGGATITGTTSINNSGAALTTTIGNNFAGNTVSIDAPVVNMANLPAGAATDALITTNGTALYETPAATIIGNTAWLIGNNTFTAASATRTIGIAAQGASQDALQIQTDGTARMTFGGTGGIRAHDALNISALANQLELGAPGAGNSVTITAPAPAGDRAYTIPDANSDAEFVLTEGDQTINTNLTFTGTISAQTAFIQGGSPLVFEGSTVNAFQTTLAISNPTTANTITFPNASGTVVLSSGSGQVLVEEGVDGTDVFTILNPNVTANSAITVTLEDGTDAGFYIVKVGNRVANTSFDVILSAALGAGLTKYINYTIINP